MELKCNNCNSFVWKTPGEIRQSKSGRVFCSRSCAAKYNNKLYPKRELENNCALCCKPIRSANKYCNICYRQKYFLSDKTLEEASAGRKDNNRYTGVRKNAKVVYTQRYGKNLCCKICGYDKHVEICHIKSISSFTPQTLISVINDVENLICLCPNHHWEFDNGLLGLAGFEPATPKL